MQVIKCDKCGRETNSSVKHLEGLDQHAGSKMIVVVEIEKDSTIDLCDSCARIVVANAMRPSPQQG